MIVGMYVFLFTVFSFSSRVQQHVGVGVGVSWMCWWSKSEEKVIVGTGCCADKLWW